MSTINKNISTEQLIDWIKYIVPKRDFPIIFRHQLSWYLVPLLIIIWILFPQTHIAFAIPMILIFIIGLIETIFFTPVSIQSKTISVILHVLILIPIIYNYITPIERPKPKSSCLKRNYDKSIKKQVTFSDRNIQYWRQDFRYLVSLNIWNLILIVAGILLLTFLPYWPYYMSRTQFIVLAIVITVSLWTYAYF